MSAEILDKHLDRIERDRDQRRALVRQHWPELLDIQSAWKGAGKIVGIKAPWLEWGNCESEDGVTADVWLANSVAEKYMRELSKGKGK